jgi:hypothetical protein
VALEQDNVALGIADMSSGSLVFSNLPYMTLSVAFIQMLKVCASVAKRWHRRNNKKLLLMPCNRV